MKRVATGYEFLARILMMIVVVHIAGIVHTLLGLVAGGFFPSIAAGYCTYRTWIQGVEDRSWTVRHTWVVFHRSWKSELVSANAFGYPQLAVGMLLVWEYWFVQANDLGGAGVALSGALVVICCIYGLFMLMSWAMRANFREKPLWIVRTTLSLVVARPLCSLMVLLMFILISWGYCRWSGLMAAFGLSLPAFATMMSMYSWARIPGMDIHDIEPTKRDLERRRHPRG